MIALLLAVTDSALLTDVAWVFIGLCCLGWTVNAVRPQLAVVFHAAGRMLAAEPLPEDDQP